MKTENVLNAMTGGIVLTWLSLTEYGVFFVAAIAGVSLLAFGVVTLSYLFFGADASFRWVSARARTLPSPVARPSVPRVVSNLMKRA